MIETKIYESLMFLFTKSLEQLEEMSLGNTTYIFFKDEVSQITYTLIHNMKYNSYYLSVNSQSYVDTIRLTSLAQYNLEKSQIFWDVLEMGGIKQFSFNLVLKNGIPNSQDLMKIDWDMVQVK
jgi:hypothetical protein